MRGIVETQTPAIAFQIGRQFNTYPLYLKVALRSHRHRLDIRVDPESGRYSLARCSLQGDLLRATFRYTRQLLHICLMILPGHLSNFRYLCGCLSSATCMRHFKIFTSREMCFRVPFSSIRDASLFFSFFSDVMLWAFTSRDRENLRRNMCI